MTKFIPTGFNADAFKSGIHKAMGIGEPNADPVTFYIEQTSDLPPTTPVDDSGLPFNPAVKRPKTHKAVKAECALEYIDRAETSESFGTIQPSKVKITLLDDEYQKIKGFAYLVAGGDKYYHSKTEPPIAMASVDVWTVHATTQDET